MDVWFPVNRDQAGQPRYGMTDHSHFSSLEACQRLDGTLKAGKVVFGVADAAVAARVANPEGENDNLELQTPVDAYHWRRYTESHEQGNGSHPHQRGLARRGNLNLTFFGVSVIQVHPANQATMSSSFQKNTFFIQGLAGIKNSEWHRGRYSCNN